MTHKKFSQSGSVDESLRLLKYRVVQSKTDELDIVKAWNGFLATSRAEGHALKQGAIKNGEKQTALGYYKCQKLHVFYNYTVQRNTLYGQAPRQLQQKKKAKPLGWMVILQKSMQQKHPQPLPAGLGQSWGK